LFGFFNCNQPSTATTKEDTYHVRYPNKIKEKGIVQKEHQNMFIQIKIKHF